jgi:hypothetical protein
MTEDTFVITPTVLALKESGRFGFITVAQGSDEEALVVFRGPEEVRKYQDYSGKHTAEEGFEAICMGPSEIAATLEEIGIRYVVMPEPWVGGHGGVDWFEANRFLQLLEESPLEEEHGAL